MISELLNVIQGGIENGDSVEKYREKYLYKQRYGAIVLDYKFHYSEDEPSDAFFRTEILGQKDSASHLQPKKTLYTKCLENARKFFAEKVQGLDQKTLADIFIKVTEHLKFNEFLVTNPDDIYVIFETMNDRKVRSAA